MKHFHAGEFRVGKQLSHVVCDNAKILGNDFCLWINLCYGAEELDARRAVPLAVSRRFFAVRYVVISRKSAEMIYSENIVKAESESDTLYPPGKV